MMVCNFFSGRFVICYYYFFDNLVICYNWELYALAFNTFQFSILSFWHAISSSELNIQFQIQSVFSDCTQRHNIKVQSPKHWGKKVVQWTVVESKCTSFSLSLYYVFWKVECLNFKVSAYYDELKSVSII